MPILSGLPAHSKFHGYLQKDQTNKTGLPQLPHTMRSSAREPLQTPLTVIKCWIKSTVSIKRHSYGGMAVVGKHETGGRWKVKQPALLICSGGHTRILESNALHVRNKDHLAFHLPSPRSLNGAGANGHRSPTTFRGS